MKTNPWSMILFLAILAGLGWAGWQYLYPVKSQETRGKAEEKQRPLPVEVADIRQGTIHSRLTFSGTLEARAEFVVAPKVGGMIRSLDVDLSDTIKKGELVAELDNDEAIQDVLQAKADLAVATATQSEAESALEIAVREFERIKRLKARGIASDSQFDSAMAGQQAKRSLVAVARAQVLRGKSLLEAANIRLGYARVTADWPGSDENRLVAERYVDAGQMVSANTPLLLISRLEPITGIVQATEKEYASLSPGQKVSLSCDAYPGDVFNGTVDRISPVFNKTTRQARIELVIANPDLRLKPGMFIRAFVDVATVPNATLVPEMAITTRQDQTGVFVVKEPDETHPGLTAAWCPVSVGIIQERQAQVQGEGLEGRVVILGQELLTHGSAITIPGPNGRKKSPDILGTDK